jgi:hypothetical protein
MTQERRQAHDGMPILDNYSGFQANAATLENRGAQQV